MSQIRSGLDENKPSPALDGSVPIFVAVFDETQFIIARSVLVELRSYDYDDWLDVREGRQIALAMAGVDARLVQVDLASFLEWCGRCARRPSEEALDAFAAAIGQAQERALSALN